MKQPDRAAVLAPRPLSRLPLSADRLAVCNVCGAPGDLRAHRACSEWDVPIDGDRALVFVAEDHPACQRALEDHPQRFVETMGWVGHFPRLCGRCVHRRGMACSHPALKANGGKGLWLTVSTLSDMIARLGDGCHQVTAQALGCEGQQHDVEASTS